MDFRFLIGFKIFLFARARTRIYSSLIALSFLLAFSTFVASAPASPFILGHDSLIHAVSLDRNQEPATRHRMHITQNCGKIKPAATASALTGSAEFSIDPTISSKRGVIVLEGLVNGGPAVVLHSALLNTYKNYPTSIPGELNAQSHTRYALAVTFAASVIGAGDLKLRKGDQLIIHADGQLYAYALPTVTIPSEGLLTLYAGTDDTLYYDAALTHPFHSGSCGGKKS